MKTLINPSKYYFEALKRYRQQQKRCDHTEILHVYLSKTKATGKTRLIQTIPLQSDIDIALYEASNKPEKAEKWRAQLAQIEDIDE